MILRDYWFCWVNFISWLTPIFHQLIPDEILSIAFELAEYSLQHQLPNFAEVCALLSECHVATQLIASF